MGRIPRLPALAATALAGAAAAVALPAAAAPAATLSEFPIAGSGPLGAIEVGPDGRLLVADPANGAVRRIGPGGGERPPVTGVPSPVVDLLAAEDGTAWALVADGTFGRVDLSAGPAWVGGNTGDRGVAASALAMGHDGRTWYVDPVNDVVGATATGFVFSEADVPGAAPSDVAVAPDGAVWVAARGADTLLGFDGTLATPTATAAVVAGGGAAPSAVAAAADGTIVYSAPGANAIGRFDPADPSPVAVEVPLPTPGADPGELAPGPDGAIWFVERGADRIGRITTTGALTEYALAPGAEPVDIVAGPDGAMWFTQAGTRSVGRLTTDADPGAGPQGPRGDPGADGRDGASGRDGAPGTDGGDGAPGAAGRDGASGRDGAAGARGGDGAAGANGRDGAAGARGGDGVPLRARCAIRSRRPAGARQRIVVGCRVTGATRGRAVLRWRIALGRRTVATGTRTTRAGVATFALPLVPRPARGRYALTISPSRPAPPAVRLAL